MISDQIEDRDLQQKQQLLQHKSLYIDTGTSIEGNILPVVEIGSTDDAAFATPHEHHHFHRGNHDENDDVIGSPNEENIQPKQEQQPHQTHFSRALQLEIWQAEKRQQKQTPNGIGSTRSSSNTNYKSWYGTPSSVSSNNSKISSSSSHINNNNTIEWGKTSAASSANAADGDVAKRPSPQQRHQQQNLPLLPLTQQRGNSNTNTTTKNALLQLRPPIQKPVNHCTTNNNNKPMSSRFSIGTFIASLSGGSKQFGRSTLTTATTNNYNDDTHIDATTTTTKVWEVQQHRPPTVKIATSTMRQSQSKQQQQSRRRQSLNLVISPTEQPRQLVTTKQTWRNNTLSLDCCGNYEPPQQHRNKTDETNYMNNNNNNNPLVIPRGTYSHRHSSGSLDLLSFNKTNHVISNTDSQQRRRASVGGMTNPLDRLSTKIAAQRMHEDEATIILSPRQVVPEISFTPSQHLLVTSPLTCDHHSTTINDGSIPICNNNTPYYHAVDDDNSDENSNDDRTFGTESLPPTDDYYNNTTVVGWNLIFPSSSSTNDGCDQYDNNDVDPRQNSQHHSDSIDPCDTLALKVQTTLNQSTSVDESHYLIDVDTPLDDSANTVGKHFDALLSIALNIDTPLHTNQESNELETEMSMAHSDHSTVPSEKLQYPQQEQKTGNSADSNCASPATIDDSTDSELVNIVSLANGTEQQHHIIVSNTAGGPDSSIHSTNECVEIVRSRSPLALRSNESDQEHQENAQHAVLNSLLDHHHTKIDAVVSLERENNEPENNISIETFASYGSDGNEIVKDCQSAPLVNPTTSECTFYAADVHDNSQSHFDGSLCSFEDGLVQAYKETKGGDYSHEKMSRRSCSIEDECPQLQQAMLELEAFDWRSELVSPVATTLPERRRTDTTELFLPGNNRQSVLENRASEDLSEPLPIGLLHTPASTGSSEESAFNWRNEIESPLLRPRLKRRKQSSLVPISTIMESSDGSDECVGDADGARKIDCIEELEINTSADLANVESSLEAPNTMLFAEDQVQASHTCEGEIVSNSPCSYDSGHSEEVKGRKLQSTTADTKNEAVSEISYIRVAGNTLLFTIDEEKTNALSVDEFQRLIVENCKLHRQNYEMRKSYEERIGPFRELLEEKRRLHTEKDRFANEKKADEERLRLAEQKMATAVHISMQKVKFLQAKLVESKRENEIVSSELADAKLTIERLLDELGKTSED